MDGMVKIINPASLLPQNNKATTKQSILGVAELPVAEPEYFVEISYAVMDAEYI